MIPPWSVCLLLELIIRFSRPDFRIFRYLSTIDPHPHLASSQTAEGILYYCRYVRCTLGTIPSYRTFTFLCLLF
ncbi:hypothetical protein B484DRAFT_443061 [Ochromonadaceae sp. CCMP2298]|nr:hypothetical protein B484DRAFT_443061 [Ochromonadaceae sp. CCMP2298]